MSDISLDAIEQLESVLDAKSGGGPNGSATGRVTRVDADGTAWVHVFGGEGETPLRAYGSAVQPGDVIGVEQRGNGLYASGNWSRPSTDDEAANAAQRTADAASSTATRAATASQSAKRAADEAQAVADATAQHFFSDTDGVHVTEAEQDVWAQQHSGKNILINSLGILLRNALNNLVSITASAIAFFDGSGNAASNIIAQFGGSGATIGKSGESHMELDYHSLQLVDKEGDTYFHVSDLRDSSGIAEIVEHFVGDGSTRTFTFDLTADSTDYTVKVDDSVVTSGLAKETTNVFFNSAPSDGASIEVTYTTSSRGAKAYTVGSRLSGKDIGAMSLAEGLNNVASEFCSHAEGMDTEASGNYSHAEGCGTTASRGYAHAEGLNTTASGVASHAEGYSTKAKGSCSHAQNEGTIAAKRAQTALGAYSIEDTSTTTTHPSGTVLYGQYALIIGNGTSNASRSNAFMVDWDGYIYPCDEKMPDWVVEQGTSGIWTYRKWHSGVAECWGTYSASIAITSSSASYGGYRSAQITATAFPSGTFTAAPTVTATSMSSGGNWVTNTNGSTSTNAKFYLSCGTSSAASTRDIAIHAIGKWK